MTNNNKEKLNHFFASCFNYILRAEERALESISNGKLTLKEIHFIEAVFKAMAVGENCLSTLARMLRVTMGTAATSFKKLEQKGYLYKEQDQQDKRIYYIIPTKLAELVNREHTAFHEEVIDDIVKHLNGAELDALTGALEKMAEYFDDYN